MVILWIIGAIFLALIVIVPLIERFGPRLSQENMGKLSRLIFPLLAILLISQLLFYVFAK